MPSALGKNCVYCHKVFNVANVRAPSLAASPPHRPGPFDKNLLEIVNALLPNCSILFPNFKKLSGLNNFKGSEDRFLCVPCAKVLYEAYKAIEALERLKSTQSLIYSHCSEESTKETSPEDKPADKPDEQLRVKAPKVPPVPVGTQIKQIWSVKSKRAILLNKVKIEAFKELKQFAKVSKVLRMEEYGKDESLFASRDKDLQNEMEIWCPTVLELMYGIFTRKPWFREFTPSLRTGIAIAAFNLTSKCSGFQKNLSYILYEHSTPVKVYGYLHELRMCMAYQRTTQLLNAFLKKDEERGEDNDGGGGGGSSGIKVEMRKEDIKVEASPDIESESEGDDDNDNFDGSDDESRDYYEVKMKFEEEETTMVTEERDNDDLLGGDEDDNHNSGNILQESLVEADKNAQGGIDGRRTNEVVTKTETDDNLGDNPHDDEAIGGESGKKNNSTALTNNGNKRVAIQGINENVKPDFSRAEGLPLPSNDENLDLVKKRPRLEGVDSIKQEKY